MPESNAPFRAEAIVQARPGRIVGPRLPPPRSRLRTRLLALLRPRRGPAACPAGACL